MKSDKSNIFWGVDRTYELQARLLNTYITYASFLGLFLIHSGVIRLLSIQHWYLCSSLTKTFTKSKVPGLNHVLARKVWFTCSLIAEVRNLGGNYDEK